MAAPSKIYKEMAKFLSSKGINVVYYDPRGVGENGQFKTASLQDWCTDIENIGNHFIAQGKNIHFLGHSIGGQIYGRLKNPDMFQKVIFLCTSSGVWWKNQHIPTLLQSAFVMNIYIPVSNFIFGYTNAKLVGMGENLPSKAASEWAKWCRSQNYLDDHRKSFQYDHYKNLDRDILNIVVADDPIANKQSNLHLKRIYSNCDFDDYVVQSDKPIGHLGFSKPHLKERWEIVANYVMDNPDE